MPRSRRQVSNKGHTSRNAFLITHHWMRNNRVYAFWRARFATNQISSTPDLLFWVHLDFGAVFELIILKDPHLFKSRSKQQTYLHIKMHFCHSRV